jgi:hypothetical protein
MSSKRILVVTLAFLVSLTASLTLAAADAPKASAKAKKSDANGASKATAGNSKSEDKAPRLTIVEPVKDYGTVPKGDKLDWSFEIRNTGTADLQVIAAKPSCGCTVADFDKVIKPGATGKVTAHVDTTAFAGPISKGITLETNDPSTPTSQLTIHAIVKPFVEAHPAGFVRYTLLQGDAETQSVTLYSEEDDPFEIVKIESPDAWTKVNYRKIEKPEELAKEVGRPGQNQYKLDITVGGPDAKVGPLFDRIHIVTNSKHQPDYYISISGVIRPTLRIEPTLVNFGEVTTSDKAAARSVFLHSNDTKLPGNFVVTKAESNVATVQTEVKLGVNKGDYEVSLELVKDAKPGDFDGTVKIYTNDKISPVITVPIKGTIKPAVAPATTPATK